MTDQPEVDCPTPIAHKRLEEVHRFWHECVDGYQDPENFRAKLNACIQAGRNLTFALQNEKSKIPGFDEWYAAWQERMKADPVMKWLNEARIKIVHQGDLETESQAIVRLQIDYADAGREVLQGLPQVFKAEDDGKTQRFDTKPMQSIQEIVEEVRELSLPTRIRNESTITIERRWIDSKFPSMELLDALAHVYGVLSQIVESAHELVGLEHNLVFSHEGQEVSIAYLEVEGGRLPCMTTSRALRTAEFHLVHGSPATGGKIFGLEPSAEFDERSARKYGLDKLVPVTDPKSPIDLLPMYISGAKAIAATGEEHGWFIFLFRGAQAIGQRILMARDAADKRNLAQVVAEMVAVNRADGIIEIGEVWQAPMTLDTEGAFIRPAVHEERTEAIMIWAETSAGEKAAFHIPIRRRKFRKPIVGDLVELDMNSVQNNFLNPVRLVWSRKSKPAAKKKPKRKKR